MFKDYDKYLSTTLKVYLFVLIVIFIMKIVGLDYFGISQEVSIIMFLDKAMDIYIVRTLVNFVLIMVYQYIMVAIITNKKVIKQTLISIPFTFLFNAYVKMPLLNSGYTIIIEILYLLILCLLIVKKPTKEFFKRFFSIVFMNLLFQIVSNITRNDGYIAYVTSRSINLILNLDYLMMMLITYEIYKTKGENELCLKYLVEVGLSLLKKIHLKQLLKRLQVNYLNFKKQNKETKLTIIIYFILSLIWNLFTIFIVLLIATLNHTFIECIFILTSFWLSKRVFGKAFHLSSMLHCFIVSNLTYYFLNRITTPLGISILVPIMLGVGLSYVTSKLVKKTYKPLYRGMPEDLFEETILKVADKDSIKYKICYESYILNKSDLSISFKYNYSLDNINKIKTRINNKIKKLN